MATTVTEQKIESIKITREELIDAPIDIVFQAVLDELGPDGQKPDGSAFPLKLDARPGGLWIRDLGDNAGHFWGQVQVIKPPTIIELSGPMFMSFAAANHILYRLAVEGNGTRLKFAHTAIGHLPKEHLEGIQMGWTYKVNRVKELAEKRKK